MKSIALPIYLLFIPLVMNAQPNYDESKVPEYVLPDPLVRENGVKLEHAQGWTGSRRAEILNTFSEHVYGSFPRQEAHVSFVKKEISENALDGKAIRKQIEITTTVGSVTARFDLLIYLPAKKKGPVPLLLGLNFRGNHAIHSDPEIQITDSWMYGDDEGLDFEQRAQNRGSAASRWPVEQILARGYGVATVYAGDIDPDRGGHWDDGVHPLFYKNGQTKPGAREWGTLGAWAWGLSRAMDYLVSDSQINDHQIALLGHSRMGKATLWAGANDTRFNIVISNDSGCGGAALFRRKFGETAQVINNQFPHWFCDNFEKFNGKEEDMPVDQHMLVALVAPRPVYIASAEEDQWADPKGEFLAGLNAKPVYELLGLSVDLPNSMPPVGKPTVTGSIGYHIRSGEHDLTAYDWQRFMDFADFHFGK